MFPFYLKYQQSRLNKRLHLVNDKRITAKNDDIEYEAVKDLSVSINSVAIASDHYNNCVKKMSGHIKSLIPFTKEFNARLFCADRIAETHKKLDQTERAIKKGKPKTTKEYGIRKIVKNDEPVATSSQYLKVFKPAGVGSQINTPSAKENDMCRKEIKEMRAELTDLGNKVEDFSAKCAVAKLLIG